MNARYFHKQFLGAQPGTKVSKIEIKIVILTALLFIYLSLSGGS